MPTETKKRYVKFEKLVLVKEDAGYYDIPETVSSSNDAYKTIVELLHLEQEPSEVFGFLTLNTKGKVTGANPIFRGTLDAALAHPREIFKTALTQNASSILLFHNHPSGDPEPSPEDLAVTRRICEAGKLLGIDVLDHNVIGDGCFTSLKSQGAM